MLLLNNVCQIFLSLCQYPGNVTDTKSNVVRNIIDSKIVKQVFWRDVEANTNVQRENMIVDPGLQWSDEFEPNSKSKSNREPV